jgi:hypothetical protein
MKVIFV